METPRDRDDQLAAELRALRPKPRPGFTAELDERAAAGFPRRSRLPRLSGFTLPRPRRLLLPAGGAALAAIAVATAVIAIEDQSPTDAPIARSSAGATNPENGAKYFDGRGRPERAGVPAHGQANTGVQFEAEVPAASTANSAGVEAEPLNGIVRHSGRAVERSATLVLGAAPGDIADDSAKVFEVVRAHDGIVMRSSTQEGEPGRAGARFELLIPSAKLGDALADLSAIDEVRSRHEATADITAPTVNVTELLRDSQARIDSLLGQLEGADTESEREAVEAELRQERRHRARLRSQLQNLQRRADYSRVLVRIETGGTDESGTGGGTWGVGDALGDAGQILAVAAAVAVVGLAILGPIALVALLAWLTHRAWVRRERRRVLS